MLNYIFRCLKYLLYKCHGFRPQHRILDGRKQRLLLHYREMKLEVAKWGTPKKYIKKENQTLSN
jgi:hypothetical protein